MKSIFRFLIVFSLSCFVSINTFSQASGMIGISGGYGQTAYSMKSYDPAGFMPLGIRAAIGAYGIQFGPEFWITASCPNFNITDSAGGTEQYSVKIHDNYFGGMIRAHAGDDPRDFAITFRVGIGVFFSKKDVDYSDLYLIQNPDLSDGTVTFKNSIGYNGALGVSIPLGDSNFHITLEGQYVYNPRKYDNTTNYHTAWNIQLGVSYNIFNYYNIGHY
ncbi:MAG: hypothetical protein V1904_15255 [Bacteroidota bacterium]